MPTQLRFWNELRQWSLVPDGSISFATEPANEVFAGPTSGAPAAPAFRALVAADLPSPFSGGGRLLLPTAAYPGNIFYVATNGADAPISAGGGTAAAPWLTPSFGAAQLAAALDFGGQDVLLQGVAGHNAFTSQLPVKPWVGGGSLIFDGGVGGSISTTNAHSVQVTAGPLPGPLAIQNVSLAASGAVGGTKARGLLAATASIINLGAGLSFGACAGAQIQSSGGASVSPQANYSITGGAQFHWLVDVALLAFEAPSITITLTGTPAFSVAFAYVTLAGAVQMDAPPTFVGAATGARFNVNSNGIINTGGQGPSYLPGNAAGVTNTGGQYT